MNGMQVLHDFNPKMFSEAEAPIVSIYLHTHRHSAEDQQDKLRYKNLVAQAEAVLSENYERREYSAILARLEALYNNPDRDIWRASKDGLAVLADAHSAYLYYLDYPVEDIVVVADSYHIKPLIRNFQYGSRYYLLALSSKNFELYLGDFDSLERLEMPEGVPSAFEDVFDEFDNTSSINVGSFAGMDGRFYGRDSKSEVVEKETVKYFRYVDKTVLDNFASEHPYPIILVSLPQHQATFREASTLPTLLEHSIDKPIEALSGAELLSLAKSIILEVQVESVERLVEGFGLAQALERASADPSTIAKALLERKVSVLFVEDGRTVPGKFDKETGAITAPKEGAPAVNGLGNDFAQAAYLQGGEVYALDKDMMPADTGVAALFRY